MENILRLLFVQTFLFSGNQNIAEIVIASLKINFLKKRKGKTGYPSGPDRLQFLTYP